MATGYLADIVVFFGKSAYGALLQSQDLNNAEYLDQMVTFTRPCGHENFDAYTFKFCIAISSDSVLDTLGVPPSHQTPFDNIIRVKCLRQVVLLDVEYPCSLVVALDSSPTRSSARSLIPTP